jgi:hypothetical protein
MGSQDPSRRNSVGGLGSPLPTAPEEFAFSSNIEDYNILAAIGMTEIYCQSKEHQSTVVICLLIACFNVGYGSSAIVYSAIYKPLNKQVAVKIIELDRFERNQIDELRVRKSYRIRLS